MSSRIQLIVQHWWEGTQNPVFPPHNGFYDNNIPGVKALNDFAAQLAPNTYYFTMWFDAIVHFPDENIIAADLSMLPLPFLLNHTNISNIFGCLVAAGLAFAAYIPGGPNIVAMVKWAVQTANNHLRALGYLAEFLAQGREFQDPICRRC